MTPSTCQTTKVFYIAIILFSFLFASRDSCTRSSDCVSHEYFLGNACVDCHLSEKCCLRLPIGSECSTEYCEAGLECNQGIYTKMKRKTWLGAFFAITASILVNLGYNFQRKALSQRSNKVKDN